MHFQNAPARGCDVDRLSVQAVSVAMRELERVVADIAPTDIPVLLVGESGTGKEVLAAEIHGRSRRQSEPFIKLSCAASTVPSLKALLHWPGRRGQFCAAPGYRISGRDKRIGSSVPIRTPSGTL